MTGVARKPPRVLRRWCAECGARLSAPTAGAGLCATCQRFRDEALRRRRDRRRNRGVDFDLVAVLYGDAFQSTSSRDIAVYLRSVRLDPCAYCGRVPMIRFGKRRLSDNHLDHIDAAGKAGREVQLHEWDNLTAACRWCNQRKGVKKVLMFMLGRRGRIRRTKRRY